jgi:hypothetical protein
VLLENPGKSQLRWDPLGNEEKEGRKRRIKSFFFPIPLVNPYYVGIKGGMGKKKEGSPPKGGISQKAKLFTFLGNPPKRGIILSFSSFLLFILSFSLFYF